MNRKEIYLENFQNLIFGKSTKRFEDKLLLFTAFSVSIIHIISTFFNFIFGLKTSIVITSCIGAFLFSIIYLLVRFISKNNLTYFIISIVILLFMDLIWYVNYGSKGPVMVFFVVYFAFLILLFDKRYYLHIFFIFLLNILGLYLFEYFYPQSTGKYPDIVAGLNDNYSGLIFSFFVVFSILTAIKGNYIQEFKRAKMSDQLKSSFLSNMSHEIRTPLNAIVGFSSLISDAELSADDKLLFSEQIQKNSDYLLCLIEDIIDVSKIESNQLSIKIQEVDVVPLILQIVQSYQLNIPKTNLVQIVSDLEEQRLIINTDRVRFEQILRNLVTNAVKFTEKGKIEVGCRKAKDFITFFVKDTGIGIHPDDQTVIFDRFRKIENQNQQLFRGTGIGLFLSKQLVELFKGKIWVESEPGKGSIFYFTIPS
jgi:signal transduction histidine kinase